MTYKAKFLALLVSVAVNAAALATVHASMGQITQREQLALKETSNDRAPGRRPVITVAAMRHCPPAGVL